MCGHVCCGADYSLFADSLYDRFFLETDNYLHIKPYHHFWNFVRSIFKWGGKSSGK